MCDIERLKDSRDIFNTPFQKERDGEVFRSLKRVCYLMITIFFMLTFCFATRFQTIWERMEFPSDTQTIFVYGAWSCGIGDINGDGYSDFLVNKCVSFYCPDTTAFNQVFLHLGKSFLSTQPDLVFAHRIESQEIGNDCFGAIPNSFNGLGDVNGDGYDDFAIVAGHAITDTMPWGDIACGGKVYIYFGSPNPDTIPDLIFKGDIQVNPPFWVGGGLASSICGADVNGDGYKDIIMGSSEYATSWNWYDRCRGRVYIYYGGPSIDTIPDVIINGGNYWAPFPARYEQLGYAIDNLGDVNGDGYEDIIVGAPSNMEYAPVAGKAYVFLGGDPMDTIPDWWYYGTNDLQCLGEIVSNAGDFNGDGYNDFMIGDYCYPSFFNAYGRVLLFYGGQKLDTIPDWQIIGIPGRTHDLGNSIDCIGDYNKDGYDDIVIGNSAYEYILTEDWFNGRILLYFGGQSPDTIPDAVYIGMSQWERGVARNLCNAGDVNGDGINEILFSTDYPPIVPYPDVYGWIRVAKITEAGLPDAIQCRGGDRYILIQWHGKFEEHTSYYQILKNTLPDTSGWHQLTTINPKNPPYYSFVDTAVEFSKPYYYWVRAYDNAGKFDHYGPYSGTAVPIMVEDFSGYQEFGGFVNLKWKIRGGDIVNYNLYRQIGNVREKIATLAPDRDKYIDVPSDTDVRYYLGIVQSSKEERLIGPIIPDGIICIAPNPFRNSVKIGVRVGKYGRYRLEIFNVLGQKIKTIFNEERQAGYYEFIWDGRDGRNQQLSAGVYYVRFETEGFKKNEKVILLR